MLLQKVQFSSTLDSFVISVATLSNFALVHFFDFSTGHTHISVFTQYLTQFLSEIRTTIRSSLSFECEFSISLQPYQTTAISTFSHFHFVLSKLGQNIIFFVLYKPSLLRSVRFAWQTFCDTKFSHPVLWLSPSRSHTLSTVISNSK